MKKKVIPLDGQDMASAVDDHQGKTENQEEGVGANENFLAIFRNLASLVQIYGNDNVDIRRKQIISSTTHTFLFAATLVQLIVIASVKNVKDEYKWIRICGIVRCSIGLFIEVTSAALLFILRKSYIVTFGIVIDLTIQINFLSYTLHGALLGYSLMLYVFVFCVISLVDMGLHWFARLILCTIPTLCFLGGWIAEIAYFRPTSFRDTTLEIISDNYALVTSVNLIIVMVVVFFTAIVLLIHFSSTRNMVKVLGDLSHASYTLNFNDPEISKYRATSSLGKYFNSTLGVFARQLLSNLHLYKTYLPGGLVEEREVFSSETYSSFTTNPTHGTSNPPSISSSVHSAKQSMQSAGGVPPVRVALEYSKLLYDGPVGEEHRRLMRSVRMGLSKKSLTVMSVEMHRFHDMCKEILPRFLVDIHGWLVDNAYAVISKLDGNCDFYGGLIRGYFFTQGSVAHHDGESAVMAGAKLLKKMKEGLYAKIRKMNTELGFTSYDLSDLMPPKSPNSPSRKSNSNSLKHGKGGGRIPNVTVHICLTKYPDVLVGNLGGDKIRRMTYVLPDDYHERLCRFCVKLNVQNQIIFDDTIHEELPNRHITKLVEIVKYLNESRKIYQYVPVQGNRSFANRESFDGVRLQSIFDNYEEAWKHYSNRNYEKSKEFLAKYLEKVDVQEDDGAEFLHRRLKKQIYKIRSL